MTFKLVENERVKQKFFSLTCLRFLWLGFFQEYLLKTSLPSRSMQIQIILLDLDRSM